MSMSAHQHDHFYLSCWEFELRTRQSVLEIHCNQSTLWRRYSIYLLVDWFIDCLKENFTLMMPYCLCCRSNPYLCLSVSSCVFFVCSAREERVQLSKPLERVSPDGRWRTKISMIIINPAWCESPKRSVGVAINHALYLAGEASDASDASDAPEGRVASRGGAGGYIDPQSLERGRLVLAVSRKIAYGGRWQFISANCCVSVVFPWWLSGRLVLSRWLLAFWHHILARFWVFFRIYIIVL